jgi:hypothetical protein
MNAQLRIPRDLRARVRDVATRHHLGKVDDAVRHFIERGLDRYDTPPGPIADRLAAAVESQGYATTDELVEHLVLRGLHAYEQPASSHEELAARLRGLGYIE